MTKTRRKYLLFAVLAGLFCFSTQNADVFNEELFIKPLKSGHVNTYFQFTTQWNIDSPSDLLHTHLAPRSLAELFLHYPINELHVSLTSGLWRAEKFGYPVVDAPAGAELWAWFHNDSHVDEHWVELAGTLSGLLCASLSFVDQSNTVAPEISLRPQFYDPTVKNPVLRYSTLPREVVCTENLTPWKKLLPCSYKEGLASLLRPENLYSTSYHSLGIHVRKICDSKACLSYTLEIRQTVNLVHDFVIFGGRDWSVRKLFGQGINGVCSLADSSKVYVDVTETNYEITPTPTEVIASSRGGSESEIAVFDLQKEFRSQLMNIAVVDKSDPDTIPLLLPPPIVAKRAILGVGQERGKIVTRLINKHWQSLNVVVLENIPWFVPVYLHTLALKVANSGASIKPTFIKYIPGEQRVRPYHLEIAFSIPARSTVEISIDFDYIFLKWQEYPPDANHGHYLGAAIVSVLLPVARNYTGIPVEGTLFRDSFNASRPEGYFIQLRTESLLITLPTPDFSMPYNVICLACTVVALAFGPIHNMATKKIVLKSKTETRGRISKILGRFRRKKEEEKSDEVEPEKEKTD